MKIIQVTCTFLFCIMFPTSLFTQTTDELDKLGQKIIFILDQFDSVFVKTPVQNDLVFEHYSYVKNKIQNQHLGIRYDTTLNYGFMGSAGFNVQMEPNGSPLPYLSIGKFILDKYEQYPSLIYAIMMNIFQTAHDYFSRGESFMLAFQNEIEKACYEADALYVEALFLKTYFENDPGLGDFERYLIEDLQGALQGANMLFKKTDLELLHQMDDLKKGEKSVKKSLKEFEEIGHGLIRKTEFKTDERWSNYQQVVSLRTYVYYSRQAMFDILYLAKGLEIEEFKLEDYPKNLKVIREIQGIIEENHHYFDFHDRIIEAYEEGYLEIARN